MAPERIEEKEAAATLAGVVVNAGHDDGTVTRSGRRPDCGYLLTAPGHQAACT